MEVLSEVVVKENLGNPSIPSSQHLCPVCGSALAGVNHKSWSCSNLQCPVTRVVFSDDRVAMWTKIERKGEAYGTYTRVVFNIGCFNRHHRECKLCGKPFVAGDKVTNRHGRNLKSYELFHEHCYEASIIR